MVNKASFQFYYDFLSPYSYLSSVQLTDKLEVLMKNSNIQVQYIPVSLLFILKINKMIGPALIPAKRDYTYKDVQRFAKANDIAIKYPEKILFNSLYAIKFTIALNEIYGNNVCKEFSEKVFIEIWANGKDLANWDSLKALAGNMSQEIDVISIINEANSKNTKEKLAENNQLAIDKGLFGVPSFIIEDELFWGNDRLDSALQKIDGNS